jgi:hypothetical protein
LPFSSISCTATADSTKVLDGDFTGPELLDFSPNTNRVLTLKFSEAVTVENINVVREDTDTVIQDVVRNETEDQAVVELELSEPTLLGKPYRVSGIVIDNAGNSLDFSIAFSGYNNDVPHLVLSEIRSIYQKPKCEFIELYALTGGNLAGVTLYNAYGGVDYVYEFPEVQVKAGEYIVVHYRTVLDTDETPEMFVDETGTDLLASISKESTPGRDFWVDTTTAKIGKKTDVILLRERAGGTLIDAFLYCESGKTWNDAMLDAAQEAFDNGLWPDGANAGAAFVADSVTATRTISRQNINALISSPKTAECGKQVWLLTNTSTASPGKENSDKPFVAK